MEDQQSKSTTGESKHWKMQVAGSEGVNPLYEVTSSFRFRVWSSFRGQVQKSVSHGLAVGDWWPARSELSDLQTMQPVV
jgi:hypothetical protein